MVKKLLFFLFVLTVLGVAAAGAFVTWGYYYITRDLPDFENVDDYRPPMVSTVYASDGTLAAEFYEERRYPAHLNEMPVFVPQAFLAAEDANFYHHTGIDPISILRAVAKNFIAGSARQGASTITQQVVKNLLLSPERKIKRKLKEAILSYRLEKRLSKDEILEVYLNQIFFGNNAYGIRAASELYFRKKLKELTIGEAALLAGLPKAPSLYSPLTHMDRAKKRQRYVLEQMVKAGFITQNEASEAERERIRVYPANPQNIFYAPYYVGEVRRLFEARFKELNVDRDGLKIYTALDLEADKMATGAMQKGLREVDKRRGWRGPLQSYPLDAAGRQRFMSKYGPRLPLRLEEGMIYPALVTDISKAKGTAQVELGEYRGTANLKDAVWARRRLDSSDKVTAVKPEEVLKAGDIIEVMLVPEPAQERAAQKDRELTQLIEESGGARSPRQFVLDQTPEVEGAMVLIQPDSGKVLTTIGGYSYQRSVFNRATQAYRQPGSSFKPILYLAAVDGYKYTPSTIVYDTPRTFRVGDQFWTPANFDEKFLGGITLRTALEKSRNLVSADIVSRIGVDAVIRYARKMGISSRLGRNLSIALGSSEVTVLELTRAYGVFAARGALFDSVLITKVVDRDGNVIYDYETEKLARATQVIDENSAFIMAHMMKGVIENGTGYRIKPIKRPVAGKTGTSNEQMDTWFIGYTPEWVCGVWVGFDTKKEIGEKETGGAVAAPIWLYFMTDFLNYQDKSNYERLVEETKSESERLGIDYVAPDPLLPLDFSVPPGVDPFWVDKQSGLLSEAGAQGTVLEYFKKGTEPARTLGAESSTSYLESPDL